MRVVIEEESVTPREELDALVRRAENPVCDMHMDDDSNTTSVNTDGRLVQLFSSLIKK